MPMAMTPSATPTCSYSRFCKFARRHKLPAIIPNNMSWHCDWSTYASVCASDSASRKNRKLPILLFDVMDTLVRDPFYQDVPAFFCMSLEQLMDCKHPTVWIEFEKGLIDEMELARKFFKDGRPFDLEGLFLGNSLLLLLIFTWIKLWSWTTEFPFKSYAVVCDVVRVEFMPTGLSSSKISFFYFFALIYAFEIMSVPFAFVLYVSVSKLFDTNYEFPLGYCLAGLKTCMRRGYSYIEGIEGLLLDLKESNYEMHAFTNYPVWYKLIEDKLKVSRFLSWTFCSCTNGKRKPDPVFYLDVIRHLQVDPEHCIFIDDRLKNIEAAIEVGISGIQFKNAIVLRENLALMGVDICTDRRH